MEEKALFQEMYDTFMSMHEDFHLYEMYGGAYDIIEGRPISEEKIDPRNVNPKSALEALMRAYRKAITLRTLYNLYVPKNFEVSEAGRDIVEVYRSPFEKIIFGGESAIQGLLKKFPDELTYPKKDKPEG